MGIKPLRYLDTGTDSGKPDTHHNTPSMALVDIIPPLVGASFQHGIDDLVHDLRIRSIVSES